MECLEHQESMLMPEVFRKAYQHLALDRYRVFTLHTKAANVCTKYACEMIVSGDELSNDLPQSNE